MALRARGSRLRERLYRYRTLLASGGNIIKAKRKAELGYWRERAGREGKLGHEHYEHFFTEHFDFARTWVEGKRIVDIGCGPRGSLEWASGATVRVGLDPLVDRYRELGIVEHAMTYVAAGAERLPFVSESMDAVSSFNSLDHVDDLDASIDEIVRVLRPGGLFFLLTDVNHPPTVTEPIRFSWDIIGRLTPRLEVVRERRYEAGEDGLYQSIRAGVPHDPADPSRPGILSVLFRKPE